MRSLGINNLEEACQNVASFTVQTLALGQSQVAILGVSAGQFARVQQVMGEPCSANFELIYRVPRKIYTHLADPRLNLRPNRLNPA